jgi:TRAP-type C4-dicarboxylate transport system permease small subunit
VSVVVVLLCLVGSVWIIFRDARRTGAFMLSAKGWKRRWPLYALSVAATLAVIFAAEYGC